MVTSTERLRLLAEWDEGRREALARAIERLVGMLKALRSRKKTADERPARPAQVLRR